MHRFILFLLFAILWLWPFQSLNGQGTFSANTAHHCIYTSLEFDGESYLLDNDAQIENIVNEICKATDTPMDFELIHASVASVSVVKDNNKYYLLYSKYYCTNLLKTNPILLYAVLAHEIGHIARKHQLDNIFRISEESEADEWMGRALYKLKNTNSINVAIPAIKQETFSYEIFFPGGLRERIIRDGYHSEDGLARSKGNLGYFENKSNVDNSSLPVFELKGCPQFIDLPLGLFSKASYLKHINQQLISALDQMGYSQRKYYSVPNGFAILTPVEQISPQGDAIKGQARWQDYPSVGRFDGILDYLKSIIIPKPGYFRLFAFVVTDKNIKNEGGKVDKGQASDWLKEGGFWLPDPIANRAFTNNYHVGVFLYEFQATEAIKLLEERCNPNFLSIDSHLRQSGIMNALNKR